MRVDTGHEARIAAGVSFVWNDLPPLFEALEAVPAGIERLHYRRQGRGGGLSRFAGLRQLWAHNVNQPLIDEIGRLPNLEMLHVRGLSATSLGCLRQNTQLRRLLRIGGTKVTDLDWVRGLPQALDVLFLEDFKRVSDLRPLGTLTGLRSLGFEGGMDSPVTVETLAPLAELQTLRYLFLANARVSSKDLSPLERIKGLERLECRMDFPNEAFIALKQSLPRLHCDWIRMIEEHGSLRAGKAAMMARLRKG